MEDVGRIHGTGTYDHSTKKWKIRTKEIKASATIAQLSARYKVDIPNDERKSRPFWTRYLAELRTQHALGEDAARLAAAKLLFTGNEPPTYSEFYRNPTTGEIERKPDLSPEVVRIINATSQGNYDEVKATVTKPPTLSDSLKAEVAAYIQRQKKKGHKGHYDVKAALNLFLEATGDISFRDIKAQHYRDFLAKLDATSWGERTRLNRQRMVNTFLKRLEADHETRYGFIRNPDYKRQTPEGKKVQYTLEEVKTALEHAEGINRLSLLLGLNVGAYWGDVVELKPEHVQNGRIIKARAKNRGKSGQVVGNWWLWPETAEAIQYGYTKRQLETAYAEFRQKYDLKEHKALRKFAAQWIQDNVGETESRLYRGEGVGGTHGKNYVKDFTPEQVAKLDAALKKLREVVFGGVE